MAGILGRSFPIRPHYADPVVAAAQADPPLVVQISVTSQALQRAQLRTVTTVRVAPPIVGAGAQPPVDGRATFIGQAIQRAKLRIPRTVVLSTGDPGAADAGAPLTARAYIVSQAAESARRLRVGRMVAASSADPAAAEIVGADPLLLGLVVSQALQSARYPRSVRQSPHLAAPTLTAAAAGPVAAGTFVSQALERARLRTVTTVQTAGPGVAAAAQPPVAFGQFAFQALERARLRTVTTVHAADAIVGEPPPAGEPPLVIQVTVTRQARYRPRIGRTVPRPHVAQPTLTAEAQPPVARGTFTLVDITRLLPLRPHLAEPIVAAEAQPPAPFGRFVFQAIERARLQRRVPAPHLAEPIVAPGGPVVEGITFVSQAVERARLQTRVPRPHVPAVNLTQPTPQPPVARGTFVFQAEQRPQVARTRSVPKPHLARPIVGAPAAPFIAPRPYVASQSTERMRIGRTTPEPHLPPRTLTPPPFRPTTFTGQAVERPHTRRSVPKPHTAKPIVGPPFHAPPATITSQARERPLRGRTCPRPHVAPANLAPPPWPPAIVVSQSLQRPHVGRMVYPLHLAPALVGAPKTGLVQFDNDRFEQRMTNDRFHGRFGHDNFEQRTRNERFRGNR